MTRTLCKDWLGIKHELVTYCKDTPLFAHHKVKVSFLQSSFDGTAQSALATQTCRCIKEMVIFVTFHARATENGSCPQCMWILPTVYVDPAHGACRSCPWCIWIPPWCMWILPTVCGSCPRCMWILPMVYVDPAHSVCGSCPPCMWILPMVHVDPPMVHDDGWAVERSEIPWQRWRLECGQKMDWCAGNGIALSPWTCTHFGHLTLISRPQHSVGQQQILDSRASSDVCLLLLKCLDQLALHL